ncbi:hypothetical protein BGX27_009334 [Mortierella sp. AM989]|nr:hypothetical protein BGX27_009334 [Mortierella sp. AM989]
MYTIGCNFDIKRQFDSCRDYEYSVNNKTCLLNYCSSEVPCYAGTCDNKRHVCVDTATSDSKNSQTLPNSVNPLITLGDDPFGTHKEGLNPVLIILMAAGGIMALGLVGCIIRTTSAWTKKSVAWATGHQDAEAEGEEKLADGKDLAHNGVTRARAEDTDSVSVGSSIGFTKNPSKFTGNHYMPSPHLHPSDSVSAFNSPLPSPRMSPYQQNNQSQVSNNSLLNPFRRGAGDDGNSVTIELNDRSSMPSRSYESLPATSEGAMAGSAGVRPSYGVDPRMSRSQSTLSRDFVSHHQPGYDRPASSLHKSMSMQQLGSRPAPPPPGYQPSNLSGPIRVPSPPIIAITSSRQPTMPMSQADMQGPYLSLDSLIEQASNDSLSSPENQAEKHMALSRSTSVQNSLVLQSGAERLPSVTVPRQSMLRHSASVPQLVESPTSPYQASPPPFLRPISPPPRNLPAGFVSSPLANSKGSSQS